MAEKNPEKNKAAGLRREAEKLAKVRKPQAGRIPSPGKGELLHELEVSHIELELQNEELREAQKILELSRCRYENLFEFAPVGYLILDRYLTIMEANLTCAGILGVSRGSLPGTRLSSFVAKKDQDRFYKFFRFEITNESTADLEMIKRPGGGTFFAELKAMKAPDDNNLYWITLTDITERKLVDQTKNDFIGMVSHELRTPLTVVIGGLNTARDKRVSEDDKEELLREVSWGADSLANILDNMLELSRFQSGHLDLEKKKIEIADVAARVISRVRLKYDNSNIILDIPQKVTAVPFDAVRIELVLFNLVDNAVKYSPPGSTVRVLISNDTEGDLVVGVSDKGTGIAPADQKKLFQPFARLPGSGAKGVGLGLVVCKRLVDAHGGRIWVESQPGWGTTFYFTIPETAS